MKNPVRWKQLGLVFMVLFAIGLFLSATAQNPTQLSGNFIGTVRLGPGKGMVWELKE